MGAMVTYTFCASARVRACPIAEVMLSVVATSRCLRRKSLKLGATKTSITEMMAIVTIISMSVKPPRPQFRKVKLRFCMVFTNIPPLKDLRRTMPPAGC